MRPGPSCYRALPTVRGGGIELRVPGRGARGPRRTRSRSTRPSPARPSSVPAASARTRAWRRTATSTSWCGSRRRARSSSTSGVPGSAPTASGVGAAFRISQSTRTEQYPDVAWNGSTFLVVWEDAYNVSAGDYDIRGQRVDAVGDLVGWRDRGSRRRPSSRATPRSPPGAEASSSSPGTTTGTGRSRSTAPGSTPAVACSRAAASGSRTGPRTPYTDLRPDVAWNGLGLPRRLAAEVRRDNGTGWLIMARYVNPDGTLSDGENSVGGTTTASLRRPVGGIGAATTSSSPTRPAQDIRGSVVDVGLAAVPGLVRQPDGPSRRHPTCRAIRRSPTTASTSSSGATGERRPTPTCTRPRVKADGTVEDANGFLIVGLHPARGHADGRQGQRQPSAGACPTSRGSTPPEHPPPGRRQVAAARCTGVRRRRCG